MRRIRPAHTLLFVAALSAATLTVPSVAYAGSQTSPDGAYCVVVGAKPIDAKSFSVIQEQTCSDKSLADARSKSPRVSATLRALNLQPTASDVEISKAQEAVRKADQNQRGTDAARVAAASSSTYLFTVSRYIGPQYNTFNSREIWGSAGTCDSVGYNWNMSYIGTPFYEISRPSRWEAPVVNNCNYVIFSVRKGYTAKMWMPAGTFLWRTDPQRYAYPTVQWYSTNSNSFRTVA